VVTITGRFASSSIERASTAMPPRPGMRMSVTSASGWNDSSSSSALSVSAAILISWPASVSASPSVTAIVISSSASRTRMGLSGSARGSLF
jgi:hypothetical protein